MTKKEFDAVKMMRQIRDELSAELAGMTLEEQKRYLREHRRASPETSRAKKPAPAGRTPDMSK